jgi:hypothetical protein
MDMTRANYVLRASAEPNSEKLASLIDQMLAAFDDGTTNPCSRDASFRFRVRVLRTLMDRCRQAAQRRLYAAHQNQHQDDDKYQTESPAGVISPTVAVRPRGQSADEKQYQNN